MPLGFSYLHHPTWGGAQTCTDALVFLQGAGDSNSELPTGVAGTLPAEPSRQPPRACLLHAPWPHTYE